MEEEDAMKATEFKFGEIISFECALKKCVFFKKSYIERQSFEQ